MTGSVGAVAITATLDDPINLGHALTIAFFSMIDSPDLGLLRDWDEKVRSLGGFVDPAHRFWC